MEKIEIALEKAKQASWEGPKTSAPHIIDKIEYADTQVKDTNREIFRNNRVISGFHSGPWVDSFKVMRTRVLLKLKEHNWSVIGVTSPDVGSGKSLIATNLSISLAMDVDRTVLLIDANLKSPSIHRLLGLDGEIGLSDYLLEDYGINELLIHPEGINRFVFLPAGKATSSSAEILASLRMAHLVRELKKRYRTRIIVVDLPPLLDHADALAVSPYLDALLLVIEAGKTSVEDVKRSVELLSSTNLIGTVLNKSIDNKISHF